MMASLKGSSLPWAVGPFCAVIGALLLITPHQFSSPAYAVLQSQPALWGAGFLLAGAGLLSAAVFAPRPVLAGVAHLFAGAFLLVLAGGFIRTGVLTAILAYSVLGLGTALAPVLCPAERPGPASRGADLFGLLIGVSTALIGAVMLTRPDQFSAAIYGLIRPALPWYGLAFVGSGLALATAQLRPALPRPAVWAAHLLVAGVYLAFLVGVALPNRAWTAIAYYGGFGAAVAILPWLGSRPRLIDPASLRTRLALALAAAAALPLIAAMALDADQERQWATNEILAHQQALATALAQDVASYVGLHRAAVAALGATSSLLQRAPDAQREALRTANRVYPDVTVFVTVDAAGTAIARSDDRPLISYAGAPFYEDARRSGEPSLDILTGHLIQRPIFAFGVPLRDPTGRFAGVVGGVLESSQVAEILAQASAGGGGVAYLVDGRGHVIAHPDASLAAAFADVSETPPVATLLRSGEIAGWLRYASSTGERLAAYARLPGLGWGAILEQPVTAALASAQSRQDTYFGLLLFFVGGAAVVGVFAANRLTAPLGALAGAVDRFAAGDTTIPLPGSRLTEVAHLTTAFGEMRDRLAARTAEREAAERAVRFLAEASSILASSLDYEATITRVAHLAVPQVADWCAVDIVAADGSAKRLAVTHVDPAKVAWADDLQRRLPPEPDASAGVSRVLRTGQSELYAEIPDALLAAAAKDAEQLGLLRAVGFRSAMIVPMVVRGRVLGAMTFVAAESGRHYGPADLRLVEDLARRAAMAVDNARLYQEAQQEARTAQAAEEQVRALNAELEQRVVERTAQIEATVKELEAFSYSVSHDLRAPLRAIDGFSRILLEEHAPQLAMEAQGYLQTVRENAQQMGHLIDDLLSFSRLSRQPLRKQPVAPTDLARRALAALHADDDGRHVEVAIGDLPACEADPALLTQVLVNLLSNALKFTRQREVARIEIGCQTAGDRPVYFVRDNGVGFDMRYAPKLFGVFQRLHRSEDFEGTGVGLAIVHRIVHRHGGQVWAEAAVDQGATFYFTLDGGTSDE